MTAPSLSSRVVAEARLWIGTPYVHQASARQGGTDCLGLIRGVWRHLYGTEPCIVPPYSEDWAEASGAQDLWRAAEQWLVAKPMQDAAAGDVLLFRVRDRGAAKHLGIQSATGSLPAFIHAYSGHSVVESPLSTPWSRRVVARFRFPDKG